MSSCQLMCIALEFTLFLLSRLLYLSTALILSVVLAGTVAVLLCHALSARGRAGRMARRPVFNGDEELEVRVEYSFFRKVAGLPSRFSLDALASATDDFRCVVGRGSSGTVFKGILDDGTAVAVKRIDGSEHVDKEFRSEVSAIGSVQHVGLIRLLGFCLVPHGTTGYLAPEWLLGAGVTENSDVYIYGMVLLEMLGGRRNLQADLGPGGSRRWSYFPKIAADKAREGRVMEVLDKQLVASGEAAVDEAGVRRMAHVALCAQEKPGARPTMARVVEMLEARGGAAVEPPPPSDMIVVDLLALDPAHGHRVGPFGLPLLPASSAGTAASSVMSVKRLVRTLILVGTVACVCSASHGMHAPTSKA